MCESDRRLNATRWGRAKLELLEDLLRLDAGATKTVTVHALGRAAAARSA
ncbi:MAG: hypothetical protein M3273_00310 [Actinomycetota bacterium]|nr:hypothetical protein [Actinomycetota bacterium]